MHIDVKLMDDELAITCGYIFLSCISHKAINPLNCCKLADGGVNKIQLHLLELTAEMRYIYRDNSYIPAKR